MLRSFICILLLWASLAYAFTDDLIDAAKANAAGKASKEQRALVLTNYKTFNLMGLGGARRNGISNKEYQANQKFFAEINNKIGRETLKGMEMDGVIPGVKDRYNAGTDTDINVSFEDGRKLRVKDIQNTRNDYNARYRAYIKELDPTRHPEGNINWAANTETDFMPDVDNIDDREFALAAKFVNGGLMYTNRTAVEVEIGKNDEKYKISLDGAEAYSNEMFENIEKKNQKFNKHSDRLHEIATLQKQIKNPEAKRILEMEMNKYKAKCQLDQSHMAKYMDRLDDLNTRLRKQNGLPDLPEPKDIHKLANHVSKKRGPTTIDAAKELYKNKDLIQQKSMQNLSETYSEIATLQSDPKIRSEYITKAAEMSNKHLTPGQQKQTIQAIEKKYGKKSPLVKALKLETKRVKYDQAMKSSAKLQKVEAVAGKINSAFGMYDNAVGIYDNYKKGGVWLVIKNQGENYLKGKVEELKEKVQERLVGKFQKNLTDRAMAAFPLLGPASALYSTYNTAYDTTRNIMTHVKVGGKTLDEHTQEGIDNTLFVSAADKQTRDANLTKMLVNLLKNEEISLPEGMTLQQARQQVLANADRGGAKFAFLDGVPKPPKEIVKKKTLDDISLDGIEGTTPEDIERDAKLTQDLIKLLREGKFALPPGMTIPQARKVALLNASASKPRFSFLIDKNKLREAQMAAHQKWKDDINPARPYQLISFRDQAYTLNRDTLELTTKVVFSTEGRRPPGGMALYRDGELVEIQPAKAETRRYKFDSEPDPMNKKKTLFYVTVTLKDTFKGMHDQLRAPTSYFYHMVWCEFDEQGQPQKKLGQTEQEVTFAVFPRGPYLIGSDILLCEENGRSLNDDARSQKLQAHLAGHFLALGADPEPSRRMADVEVYRVTLPAVLYSTYQTEKDGGFSIFFYSEGDRLGKRRFSADGRLTRQDFGEQGLVLDIGSEKEKTGTEFWYDEQGRNHGPQRTFRDGKVVTDGFRKHGKKHGRQVKIKPQNGHMQSIETFRDGKRHGVFESFHWSTGEPTLKTTYLDDIEIGPREAFYGNGHKALYVEYAIENEQTVLHGRRKEWTEEGKLVKDEQYVSGELDGKCMYYYTENGDVSRETNYSQGFKQGEERIYHDNSNLRSVTPFDADKAHGIVVQYQEAGEKTAEILYMKGRKIGVLKGWEAAQNTSKNYSGSNRLTYEAKYDDAGDMLYSAFIRFASGKPETRWEKHWTQSNGKSVKHGLERRYVGRKMILESHWDHGKLDGEFKTWYDNGQVKESTEYKQGILEGKNNKWDSYGNVLLRETRRDGLVTGERIELGKNSNGSTYKTTRHEIQNNKSVSLVDHLVWQEVKRVDGKYIRHGKTRKMVDGRIVSVGSYLDGKQAGKFVEARADGSTETKRVIDGKLDGSYELRDENGHIIKTGTYTMGQPTKEEEYGQNENGLFYRKSTYDIIDGKAVEKTRQFIEYRGEPTNYHGIYEIHRNGQLTRKTTYRDKVRHGPYSEFYDTGKPKETGTYLEGKWHGNQRQYDEQGNLTRDSEYDKGLVTHARYLSRSGYVTEQNNVIVDGRTKPHGKQTRKKNDQMLSIETYDQGVHHGEYSKWDEDGSLTFQEIYDQGVVISATKFSGSVERRFKNESNWMNQDGKQVKHGVQCQYLNDQLVKEESYGQGQKIGTWERWSDTGTPLLVESYDDQSRKHGPWKKWNDAGVLLLEESYVAGQYHGPYRSFTDQGQPKEAIDYENGKKRQQVSYDAATGTVRSMTVYDANENKLKEGTYYLRDGKLSKTISAYTVIDGKSVRHGDIERYVDNRLQSKDTYDKGMLIAGFYCSVREGKRYMTWTPYIAQGDQSVRHGAVKQYCEGDMTSEETYDHGQLTQRTSYSKHKGVIYKNITPYAVFDGENLSHGAGKVYRDGVFSQENLYEKGDLVKMVTFGKRDGKALKSEYPYTQIDGKSVRHGIAKRHLDGKLIEQIEYRNGKEVK